VFDELVGLTLVLKECEVMAGPAACAGQGAIIDRARPFLDRLFSPERSPGTIRDPDYAMVYDRLAGRRIPAGADPRAPEVRLAVEAMVCRGRTTKAQRAYVTGLRQTARLDTDQAALDAAMKDAAWAGQGDPPPRLVIPDP